MLRKIFTRLPRSSKRLILVTFDIVAIVTSLLLAYGLRMDFGYLADVNNYLPYAILLPLTTLPFCYRGGFYSAITRHSGILIVGSLTRFLVLGLVIFLAMISFWPEGPLLPRSVPVMYLFFCTFLIVGSRYIIGLWLLGESSKSIFFRLLGVSTSNSHQGIPVAIYGAGAAGRQLLAALKSGINYNPVAFIDDDRALHGTIINGTRVYGPGSIPMLKQRYRIQQVLLAIPSASNSQRKKIIDSLEPAALQVKTMPGLDELAQGKVSIQAIREVDLADILGREPVPPRHDLIEHSIRGKSVMVTGAGGSIGSELCRQIIQHQPRTLVLFEISEYNTYRIHAELEKIVQHSPHEVDIIPIMGSVTQPWRLTEVIKRFNVQTLYHAAAYKHVPMVEANSHHGFLNNTLGTLFCAQAALIGRVEKFVLISTDKAVRPSNIMGATKRLGELILQALNREQEVELCYPEKYGKPNNFRQRNCTCFTMVRFGNVLDSSGSVIPRFREQISEGGPVTVTHPEMIRYFMTIPEAAQLVLQAGSMARGGEVFLLEMGQPVRISDLAEKLIRLSGLTQRTPQHPDGDIEIIYSGLRPGEKLYEELLIDQGATATDHPSVYTASEKIIDWRELKRTITVIGEAFERNNYLSIRKMLKNHVEIGYQPTDDINDFLYIPPESESTYEAPIAAGGKPAR